ncbi:MAG: NOL1/NOP2/sun family putative RNA methylase [Oceanicoccus sp.]|jgi:NOL1/NOP2/sun family putative RNA methylase
MKDSFKKYFQELIGEADAEAFFDAIKEKKTRRGIRVNTLKTTRAFMKEWLEKSGYEVTESPFSKESLEITGRGALWSLKLPYHAGFTYPQDPSSSFVVDVLDPQPHEMVIDMTAAPGGKTTHIAQRMKNTGVLFANDMDTRRLKSLHSNLERLGVWNAVVLRMNAHKLTLMYPEKFDRVLLDPSCSGEGLLNTYDGKPGFWSPKSMKRYSQDQFSLLCSAFRLLKPGGRLVYSTCTLNGIEDDKVALKLLKKFPQAKLVEEYPDHAPEQIGDLKGVRFWPQKTNTKGFFCIAITKTELIGIDPEEETPRRLKSPPKKALLAIKKKLEKDHGITEVPWEWVQRDDFLFGVSKELMDLYLPYTHSLSFPVFKDNRFTHTAALWIGLNDKSGLELETENLERFFLQASLKIEAETPFPLLRYKDFPLGIARKEGPWVQPLIPRAY